MTTDPSVQQQIKERHLNTCPSESKIALVITGHHDDVAAKATFFDIHCVKVEGGNEISCDVSFRYSQLLEFNDKLIYNYGNIRLLREFPPKKYVGNKESDFVKLRQDGLQNWLTELVTDEEICEDPLVRSFFKLTE